MEPVAILARVSLADEGPLRKSLPALIPGEAFFAASLELFKFQQGLLVSAAGLDDTLIQSRTFPVGEGRLTRRLDIRGSDSRVQTLQGTLQRQMIAIDRLPGALMPLHRTLTTTWKSPPRWIEYQRISGNLSHNSWVAEISQQEGTLEVGGVDCIGTSTCLVWERL